MTLPPAATAAEDRPVDVDATSGGEENETCNGDDDIEGNDGTRKKTSEKKKLRALVVSMGGRRREAIEAMLSSSSSCCGGLSRRFYPPAFVDGVPSRSIRSRRGLMEAARNAGIIPDAEWSAFQNSGGHIPLTREEAASSPHWRDVPVIPGRRGPEWDVGLHYSSELWRKARSLNRDRAVLACLLAHLAAMRRFVDEGDFDVILEDNVRVPIFCRCSRCGVGRRRGDRNTGDVLAGEESGIAVLAEEENGGDRSPSAAIEGRDFEETNDGVDDSHRPLEDLIENEHRPPESCQRQCECARRMRRAMSTSIADDPDHGDAPPQAPALLYHGWLGSTRNLRWVIGTHARRRGWGVDERGDDNAGDATPTPPHPSMEDADAPATFPFPTSEHYGDDAADDKDGDGEGVGGTAIWGMYAYKITREGLDAVLETIRNDVGSILWKGKRMRSYRAKPVDKVVPRAVLGDGRGQKTGLRVEVATLPAFFRAPMLTSRIHPKWDPEFCKSTEYQLREASRCGGGFGVGSCGLDWDDLWLTEEERTVVDWRNGHGEWLTYREICTKRGEAGDDTR